MGSNHKHYILLISISCGLYWFAFSMIRTIIALYANANGASEWEIGIILGVYAVFPFVLAIPVGGLIHNMDKVKLLRFGVLLMAGSGILYIFANHFWILLIAQVIAGIGQLFVWLIFQVLITEGSEEATKHAKMATFSLFIAFGQLLGPLLSGILSDVLGYRSTFICYFAICLLLIVLCLKIDNEKSELGKYSLQELVQTYKESVSLLRNLGFVAALLFSFIVLFIIDVRMSFLPIYMDVLSFSNTMIGVLISLASFSALLVKFIYPYLMNRLGYKNLLIGSFVFSILLLYLAPLPHNYLSMGLLIFFTGIALAINQPLSLSLISDQTNEDQRGIAFGLRLMGNRSAQLIDPILFGLISSLFYITTAFWVVALLLSVLSFFSIYLFTIATAKNTPKYVAIKETKEV